jgi:hypothetical protein
MVWYWPVNENMSHVIEIPVVAENIEKPGPLFFPRNLVFVAINFL